MWEQHNTRGEYKDILTAVQKASDEQAVYGITAGQKAYLTATLFQHLERPLLIAVPNSQAVDRWLCDLASFLPSDVLYEFPAREFWGRAVIADSHEVASMRMECLQRLLSLEKPVVIVATVEALSFKLPKPDDVQKLAISFAVGDWLDQHKLLADLIKAGYEWVPLVSSRCQFSVRGGIIDVFPLLSEHPVRLELFGDEVDSLRYFSLATQRSLGHLDHISIAPAQEAVWLEEPSNRVLKEIEKDIRAQIKSLEETGNKEGAEKLAYRLNTEIGQLQQGVAFPGHAQYFSYFVKHPCHLAHYLGAAGIVVWDEPARLLEQSEHHAATFLDGCQNGMQAGLVISALQKTLLTYQELVTTLLPEQTSLTLSLLPRQIQPHSPKGLHSIAGQQASAFHGQIPMLIQEIRRWQQNRFRIVIMLQNLQVAERLAEHLREEHVLCGVWPELPSHLPSSDAILTVGPLSQGFEIASQRLVVLGHGDVFGAEHKRPLRRKPRTGDETVGISSFTELNPGDYVVHVHHGIGQYRGLKALTIENVQKDFLFLQYRGEDKLYVPVDQINLVQKYVGSEGKKPKIYALGGGDWQRVKQRVKASVKEMAHELLKLYADRQTLKGTVYGPDTQWQLDLESAFPFEETPDQLQSIADVKKDMEAPLPMDRLICGDVGYGKTEVAIRAAFKACMEGKQVAILVPTTILAHQHFNTISSRFSEFPIKVAMMSRFRSRQQNQQTGRALKQGIVDVVIGTHRLLQKDIQFNDLGLLVIDEEQRFGVAHKERIKQLQTSVDVLSLSATPIPRTLHMAMVGIRDLSVIETPPANRYPIQTYVLEHEPSVVREAIERELNRGGQIYYVYNRVKGIKRVADQLAALVPNARIGIGHGQMQEQRLEQLMLDFLEGAFDVLVSTTIVESGLDIPNVNTIIIEDADKLGLAQLYQLRGRVGRSNRLAYAYLTFQRDKVLTEIAEKRLNAIKQFTELGAGFKIAMRDMQIRGTGNILGAEQSGFMVQVGFELYCQLLDQAVKELKGEPIKTPFESTVELNVDAYLPDRYIQDHSQRIEMYKALASVTYYDIDDVVDELIDRFGDPPVAVQQLITVTKIRTLTRLLRIQEVSHHNNMVRAIFTKHSPVDPKAMAQIWQQHQGLVSIKPGENIVLEIKLAYSAGRPNLALIVTILEKLWHFSQVTEEAE